MMTQATSKQCAQEGCDTDKQCAGWEGSKGVAMQPNTVAASAWLRIAGLRRSGGGAAGEARERLEATAENLETNVMPW